MKFFGLYLSAMDDVGAAILSRVKELLAQRPDLDEAVFFKSVKRGTPSWRSEFLSGKRTTNDLRLVVSMARFFRVPVGYLLKEGTEPLDAATLTLLGAWKDLKTQRDRDAVMQLALTLGRDAGAAR